ncbi:MAG: CD1871A family CXXC motif-containing protein [Proteobacteria bacterium]|nr:CD1871A family CXXC motif-containing protein [Pseudomonadota bacterium]
MKIRVFLPYIFFLIFSALFILGINSGEYKSVLEKAIKICLSCIGIG